MEGVMEPNPPPRRFVAPLALDPGVEGSDEMLEAELKDIGEGGGSDRMRLARRPTESALAPSGAALLDAEAENGSAAAGEGGLAAFSTPEEAADGAE